MFCFEAIDKFTGKCNVGICIKGCRGGGTFQGGLGGIFGRHATAFSNLSSLQSKLLLNFLHYPNLSQGKCHPFPDYICLKCYPIIQQCSETQIE